MQAIVIGAGIGGLAAAIALRQAGVEAQVYERAPELLPVGAGLGLWANGLRALDSLGVGDAVRSLGTPNWTGTIRTWRGAALGDTWSPSLAHRHGPMMTVLRRADLHAALLRALGRDAVCLGAECTYFRQDQDGVTAHFADGREARADLLVGADGLYSAVRAQLWGRQQPLYAGYTAWRGLVRFDQSRLLAGESWGYGARFGMMAAGSEWTYWFATANAPRGASEAPEKRGPDLLRRFAGWHAPVEALIAATPSQAILRNDIYDRRPLRRWGLGRVTLLGDAAHPMAPNLAQGACQAMEDAAILGQCVRRAAGVPEALRAYEAERIPRTATLVTLSRRSGVAAQWEGALACRLRDWLMRALPTWTRARLLSWIAGYDPGNASAPR